MHDPSVLAFDIPKPWPSRVRLGNRTIWRFRPMVRVWHEEPKGADSGTFCKRASAWKFHVHHWRLQIPAWLSFRKRYLLRCDWCKQRGPGLNFGRMSTAGKKIWHEECLSADGAYASCLCANPTSLQFGDYGRCSDCQGQRSWNRSELQEGLSRIYRLTPIGKRPSDDIVDMAHSLVEMSKVAA